jgi:hypothetical protein
LVYYLYPTVGIYGSFRTVLLLLYSCHKVDTEALLQEAISGKLAELEASRGQAEVESTVATAKEEDPLGGAANLLEKVRVESRGLKFMET